MKNELRTIRARIVQKIENNELRPKFTGSYWKKACTTSIWGFLVRKQISMADFNPIQPGLFWGALARGKGGGGGMEVPAANTSKLFMVLKWNFVG